jgi:urease accessory protein
MGVREDVDARHKAGHDGGGSWGVLAITQSTEIFAANRATGRIALTIAAENGRSVRRRLHESGSLRVRFPIAREMPEAVIVNTGGGMAGGDRFSIDIGLESGAALVAGTVAAEKIYRSTGDDAVVDVQLSVGRNARLAWLPQETILFNAARLARRIDVDLAEGGALIMAEAVVFGRTAMGEAMCEGAWRDRWRVRIGGRLVFAENVRLEGAIADKLTHRAVARGGCAVATLLVAPGDEGVVAKLREIECAGELGTSAWNGIALVRFCASDGAILRRDLMQTLGALGQPVPRLWLL